jgi:TrmH family RNA methyltransferase
MITSVTNAKIKHIRRLLNDRRYRQSEGAFVIEGPRWLAEMASAKEQVQLILVTEQWLTQQDNRHLLQTLELPKSSVIQQVTDQVMAHVSDTETPSGVLAVITITPQPLPQTPDLILVLDRIADPGNMGAIIRTSAASGVDALLAAPGCVDFYNPKVVRSSMGAHLRLPLLSLSWLEIEQHTAGTAVWLAAANGRIPHYAVDWRQPSTLIIGSEASGAGRKAANLAHNEVTIPMSAQTESLNAAVAAGIILFEARRQRTFKPDYES